MRVKRYQARTIQEAMGLVKKDLGPEALIVATQKVRGKSGEVFEGRSEWFEVTAIPSGENAGPLPGAAPPGNREAPPARAASPRRLEVAEEPLEMGRLGDLLSLMDQREDMLELLLTDPAATQVYVTLVRRGISPVRAREWMAKAGAGLESGLGARQLWTRVTEAILGRIQFTDPFGKEDGQAVCAYIGPTGVGKTTTIAKLAAGLSLARKKTVGLLSIDNYRIGAVEQLKTYASILGLPFHQAFNRDDLEFALGRLRDKDVVLIDTAGQSQYDAARMREMEKLLGREGGIETHLVLSAVTCETEMEQAAARFGELQCSSYVFTKTDETRKRGSIINQVLKRPMPLSFISTGQRVPEDIFVADKDSMRELLFAGIRGSAGEQPAESKPDTWSYAHDTAH